MPDRAKCLNSASTELLIHWLVYAYYWYVNYKTYLPSNEILGWLWMNCAWWDGRAVMIVLQMILTPGKTDRNKEKPVRLTNWSVAYLWKYIDRVCSLYYVKLCQLPSCQMDWYSSNILYLCVGDVVFESHSGCQLFWGVTWFLEPIWANPRVLFQLHHNRFLPNPL
jgi:hypothetical protein